MFDTKCLHGNRLPCGVLVMVLVMGFAALTADAEIPGASRRIAGLARTSVSPGWEGAIDFVSLARIAAAEPKLAGSAEKLARRFGVGRKPRSIHGWRMRRQRAPARR